MTKLSEQIQSLLTYANGVTGEEDATLGDAVRTLADGFGGGVSPELECVPTGFSALKTLSASGTLVDTVINAVSPYIEASPSTQIEIKLSPSTSSCRIVAFDSAYNTIDYWGQTTIPRNVVLPLKTAFIRFYIVCNTNEQIYVKDVSNDTYIYKNF